MANAGLSFRLQSTEFTVLFGKVKTAKQIGSCFSSDKVFQGFREYGYDYTGAETTSASITAHG